MTHRGSARRSAFIPRRLAVTSLLCPACSLLFEIRLRGRAVSLGEPAGVNRREKICYAPVTALYVIWTICGRGQRVRLWENFIGKGAKVHELAHERLKGLCVFAGG